MTEAEKGGREACRPWAFAALALGLLSLEILLPLLLVSALLPFALSADSEGTGRPSPADALRGALPVATVALAFLVFKTCVAPRYQVGFGSIYGLAPVSLKSFAQAGYFFAALGFEVPLMLIQAIPRLLTPRALLAAAGITAFVITLRRCESGPPREGRRRALFGLFLAALAVCGVSFFLSSYPALTYGFYNRSMLPAFLLVCVLTSVFLARLARREGAFPAAALASLCAASMLAQLDDNVASWRLRSTVLADCVRRLEAAGAGPGTFLVANVPFYTPDNYNNVEVFYLTWALEGGLKVFGFAPDIQAVPVSRRSLLDGDFNPAHGIRARLPDFSGGRPVFYYEYDGAEGRASLERMRRREDLAAKLEAAGRGTVNDHPVILRERFRNTLRSLVMAADSRPGA